MTKRRWLVATAMVLGFSGTAQAGFLRVLDYGRQAVELKKSPYVREGEVDACRAEVKKTQAEEQPDMAMRAINFTLEGIPKAYKDSDGNWNLKVKDAMGICDALAKFDSLRPTLDDFDTVLNTVRNVSLALDPPRVEQLLTAEHLAEFSADEKKCRTTVDALTKAGVTSYKHEDIATANKEICDKLVSDLVRFKAAVDEVEAANRKWWEETAAPYKKVGIGGEKLDYLVSADTIAIYGKGGKELTTPKQKKAANVTFEVLTGSDGSVTVRRYEWKGNKGVGSSQRNYPARPGASAFR